MTAVRLVRGALVTEASQLASIVPPGTRSAAVTLVGLVVLSTLTATIAAVWYRRVTTRAVPLGVAVIAGLFSISLAVGARFLASNAVVSDLSIVLDATGYFLLGTFAAGAGGAVGGRHLGDAIACGVEGLQPTEHDTEVTNVRRSARQPESVRLPETILDRAGTDPVDRALKRELAGSAWSFPRGLSAEAVASRIVARLESDYGIDRVEIEMDGPDSVRKLAIGREPSGVSASLPPRTVGVAVDRHLLGAASPGDSVDVWAAGGDDVAFAGSATVQHVTPHAGTLVAPAAESATLVGEEPDGVTTLPAVPDDEADFRSVLRASGHTVSLLAVESGGPLEGEFVGWLPVTVLVIVRDGDVVPFPAETETLRSGDDVYVFGSPDAFEALASFERARRSADQA